jgi:DNA repair exonuclease SbcCD ATPase subunit
MELTINKFAELSNRTLTTPAQVFGMNGAGKTTLYNAYLWCLTGKGKDGSDMNEAVYSQNDQLENRYASVEVELNGTTFKRTCKPVYQRERGTQNMTLKTLCATTYIVDDVEVGKAIFEKKVNSICAGKPFQLFSDLNYFVSLDKKDQTEIFMQMLGVERDEFFNGIRNIEAITTDIKETKATMKSRKEWLEREKAELAKIEIPTDYTAEIESIKKQIDELTTQRPTLNAQQIAENNEISRKIAELQNYPYKVVSCEKRRNLNAKRDAFNDELNNKNNVVRRKIEQEKELEKAKNDLKNWENNCEMPTNSPEVEQIKAKIVKFEQKKQADETLLNNYEEANKEASCGLCPHCTDIFCEHRKTDLPTQSDLMRNITQYQNDIAGMWARINEIKENWEKQRGKEYAEITKRIADLESTMPNTAEADERLNNAKNAVEIAEKEYDEETASNEAIARENEQKRTENENEIANLKAQIHVAQVAYIDNKIWSLKSQLAELERKQKTTNETNGHRKGMADSISRCNDELENLTYKLAKYESEQMQYEQADAQYRQTIMDKANAIMPQGMSVSLFRPLISGKGYENIFELKYTDKKYKNTALQIKGNFDLTCMFQRQFGVNLPIFVDDMANITDEEFLPYGENVVQLVAVKGCELCIEKMNYNL